MSRVAHVQVLMKPGLVDVEGRHVQESARRHLGVETGRVRSGKIFSVVMPLEEAALQRFAREGLADGVLHDVFVDDLHDDPTFRSYLLVAKLPGVTDDEGASAQRTLVDMLGLPAAAAQPQQVFSQDVYYFERALPAADLQRLGEGLLGNPLVHHFEHGARLTTISYLPEVNIEADEATIAVDLEVDDARLVEISKERVLSLSIEEMKAIRDHYREAAVRDRRLREGLPSSPTDCELEILAQTWSEHCKHKEFNARIHYTDADTGETRVVDSLFKTFIRGSTDRIHEQLAAQGSPWLVKVFTDNAGVVRVDDERVFVFKVETHNSPSALDPYGGALTGILGVNRDPLGTGRGGGRLLFNTNVLCFAPPGYDKPLLTGQLHPSRVFAGVRKGIEDGGNKSGVPTVGGAIVFDDRFAGKPLVFCGTGSLMPAAYGELASWDKEVLAGDAIVMAGGRVGKDGIHGATFSSVEIDPKSPRSAVQIGSPITQKQLSDFLERACAAGLIRCTTDDGAGGLASSVGELATISGGATVGLDDVPLKYAGLRPWEIFLSESQERMTFAVAEGNLEPLFALARDLEVELSRIGRFDASGELVVRYRGRAIAALDLHFLHEGVPRKTLEAEWRTPRLVEPAPSQAMSLDETLLALMASLDICSRERVIRQYDHEVKGRSIVKPLMGPWGHAPQDAAVMRLGFDSWVGLAISHGILPRYADLDAYEMSAGAFDEALRQILAVSGRLPSPTRPLGFFCANDNFCVPDSVYDPKGNPDGKYKLAQLVRMCQALYDMAVFFGVPMTSGKDSMKNDLRADGVKISVPPTVLYSMVARVDDVRDVVTAELKAAGDVLYQLGPTFDELGGSELYRLRGELGARVPRVRKEAARERYMRLERAHDRRLLESCHDLSDGGLAVALAEVTFGGVGATVTLPPSDLPLQAQLFAETHSRFLVSVRPQRAPELEEVMGGDCQRLGRAGGDRVSITAASGERLVDLAVTDLLDAFRRGLLEAE